MVILNQKLNEITCPTVEIKPMLIVKKVCHDSTAEQIVIITTISSERIYVGEGRHGVPENRRTGEPEMSLYRK